jgi:hypothetical protein
VSDYAISGDFGQQLPLGDDGPLTGERYEHVASGQIVTCLSVQIGRRRSVTLRVNGEERTVTEAEFDTYYRPFRQASHRGYAR